MVLVRTDFTRKQPKKLRRGVGGCGGVNEIRGPREGAGDGGPGLQVGGGFEVIGEIRVGEVPVELEFARGQKVGVGQEGGLVEDTDEVRMCLAFWIAIGEFPNEKELSVALQSYVADGSTG